MSRSYSSVTLILPAIIVAMLAAATPAVQADSLSQLEARRTAIEQELEQLARFSLRSGVGSIGHRSGSHTNSANGEWVQITLGEGARFDEIALVPVISHDTQLGLRSDGFPAEFRITAGNSTDTNGVVLATFTEADKLLPRIAPVIVPCPTTTASWIRIEASVLSPRAYDGRYGLELAEIFVFDGPDNIALHRPVRASSSEGAENLPRAPCRVVDGFTPYLMHSARGKSSVAFRLHLVEPLPVSLMIDLGASRPVDRIHLHAIDVDDIIPQSNSYDFCLPSRLTIEGANRPDFSDAVILTTYTSRSPFDRSPLIMLRFPQTECRYVRFTVLDICQIPGDSNDRPQIGFSEIEIFSNGKNIALHRPVVTSSSLATAAQTSLLTDGANFYGRILPLREWMEQLARRHDLEAEQVLVNRELTRRYERQKVMVHLLEWLAALLVAGLAFTILIDRILSQRRIAQVKNRLAADLHDEIGANLHTIDMLSDLAEDAKADAGELSMLHLRIRAITRRSSTAVRHFAGLLNASGLYTDLASDIRRASERIMDKFEQDVKVGGEEHLRKLDASTGFDLFLFYKECLVNIIQHSGATRFSTRLAATNHEVQLSVTDNGRGVAGSGGNRIPPSLKRRAKLMGAKLAVESPAGGGTRIVLTLRTRRWGRWK